MFAYCLNDPANNLDPSGAYYTKFEDRFKPGRAGCTPIVVRDAQKRRVDLVDAQELDRETATPESYNCYGNAIGKQVRANPSGYKSGDSAEKTFAAVVGDYWYAMWPVNGQIVVSYPIYTSGTIYFALKIGWDD